MDLFMHGIAYTATADVLTRELAKILHSRDYAQFSTGGLLLNFRVQLHPSLGHPGENRGSGILTLPLKGPGERLLRQYGDEDAPYKLVIDDRRIFFKESNSDLRTDLIDLLNRTPYQDPVVRADKERKIAELRDPVFIQEVQFGHMCRDQSFSVEWTTQYDDECVLTFEDEERRLRIVGSHVEPDDFDRARVPKEHYVLRYRDIKHTSLARIKNAPPSVVMELLSPPAFEMDITGLDLLLGDLGITASDRRATRRRVPHFDAEHQRVAPFASMALRILFDRASDAHCFWKMAGVAGLRPVQKDVPVVQRDIFSESALTEVRRWVRTLPWMVAFHVEVLHRHAHLTPQEIMDIRPDVERMLRTRGHEHTTELIRYFISGPVRTLSTETNPSALRAFKRTLNKFNPAQHAHSWLRKTSVGIFNCLHIAVTPTAIVPIEQYPDRSNRVIRLYPDHQHHFVRVSFCDEDYLPIQLDREVDSAHFFRTRIGMTMRRGIQIGGRMFEFLAYSQSALKEHSVWFVHPFKIKNETIDAKKIRARLGTFDKIIYYPALYGARMSQAFTATDPSVTVEAEEIIHIRDINRRDDKGRPWTFTDGVGTITPELADEIVQALRARWGRKRGQHFAPRAFQIRIGGSKGMVSVDYKAKGRALFLRPSMIKFDAPDSRDIEIASVFDRPGGFKLNRPLIMLLEGLGVQMEVFMRLQEDAVRDAEAARVSLGAAGKMMERHGLGAAFRLPSVLQGLVKLGVNFEPTQPKFTLDDEFPHRLVAYAVNHVLRRLKYKAQIPVPDSWVLVGIADIHGVLEEGECFACVQPPHGENKFYLRGAVMVTRSPVIHPGDVQMLRAVGKPPPGSPYDIEPIPNTIIFSTQGERPIASYLGGGDLDGDMFTACQFRELFPKRVYKPASYDAPERKRLDRPCDIDDIVDFVVDFLTHSNVGPIAARWLLLADQSRAGILDPGCLELCQMNSDAVDFQKSGTPASNMLPPKKFHASPDWKAPETITFLGAEYYQSTKAIGHLFRAIVLPELEDARAQAVREQRRQRRRKRREWTYEEARDDLELEAGMDDDPVSRVLRARVSEFLDMDEADDEGTTVEIANLFEMYATELRYITTSMSLSRSRHGTPLTEEEVVVGTIVAKASQPKKRQEMMAKMREQSALLVHAVRADLAGEETLPMDVWLKKAWLAWRFSVAEAENEKFGARSFGFIAIGSIFDAIRTIEDSLNDGVDT